jgi:hypothetical protein
MTFDSIFPKFLRPWKNASESIPVVSQGELILISSDTIFFASLVHATTPYGWRVHWARSIAGAAELLAARSSPIIVYDCGSVPGDWVASIDRLMSASGDPCIVMAAGLVSEELWQEALSRRVYDVVSRIGHGSQLVATLQFASKWKLDRRGAYMRHGRGLQPHSIRPRTTATSLGSSYNKPLTI